MLQRYQELLREHQVPPPPPPFLLFPLPRVLRYPPSPLRPARPPRPPPAPRSDSFPRRCSCAAASRANRRWSGGGRRALSTGRPCRTWGRSWRTRGAPRRRRRPAPRRGRRQRRSWRGSSPRWRALPRSSSRRCRACAVHGSPPPRTKWTRRVPHPVLIGDAASLTP